MDLFAPQEAIKFTLWPVVENNTCFTRVIVELALVEHQISYSQNKLFSPSCTVYFFQAGVNLSLFQASRAEISFRI